jgi:short-subunit dehydrogenase
LGWSEAGRRSSPEPRRASGKRSHARGIDLLLTALPSDQDRLAALADELAAAHAIRCLSVPVDLADQAGPDRLCAEADTLAFEPDLIVNSAGMGASGRFTELPLDQQLLMIRVNVGGLVHLTGLYLPRMAARGTGAVINVASTAAFQPLPYFSVYAASKAFVLSLSQALWAEARRDGVRVVSVCSGPVETPFHGDGPAPAGGTQSFLRRRYMTTQRVVDSALDAVDRRRPVVVLRMPVVGLLYYPVAMLRSFVPLRLRLLLSERLGRVLYTPGEVE